VALVGGQASLNVLANTVGSYSVTASYAGDTNNNASSSSAVTVEIGGSTSGVSPPGALTWTYAYDANGNRTNVTDPNGNPTDTAYDSLQRTFTVTQPAPSNTQPRPVIGLAYDGRDQLSGVTDARNLTTAYTVDGLGNKTATASPDTGTSTAQYDDAGNLTSLTDARGKTTSYSYDALNRLTQISYGAGGAANPPTLFEYDGGATPVASATGKLSKMSDESGVTTYSYDALGRLAGRTQSINAGLPAVGAQSFALAYGYGSTGSALGKLVSLSYPSGLRVNYRYDSAGRLSGLTVNPVNANGAGTNTATTLTVLSSLTYTGANDVLGWTWGNGTAYARSYDANGRLTSYPLGKANGTGNAAGVLRTLAYDNASRIVGMSHTSAATTPPTAQGALDQAFGYDGLDRLNEAQLGGPGSNTYWAYGYDLSGNRNAATIGTASFLNTVSPSSNQLTSVQ
jgi:YD repeat-containing protein